MELSGRLSTFALPELVQWAANDMRSGSLVVRRGQREKRVFFDGGAIVACLSDDPAESLGQTLLLSGELTDRQLLRALRYCDERRVRLGAALLETGLLTADSIQDALKRQISDAVCDLFLWHHGIFYFEHILPPKEVLLPDPIDSMVVLFEGTRWVDDYRRIRTVFADDNVVLKASASGSVPEGQHSILDKRILEAVAQQRTIEDIYSEVRGSYFRFLFALCNLEKAGALEICGHLEDREPNTNVKIRLVDSLLEKANQEQLLFLRQHLAFPIELLGSFYPVWVGTPTVESVDAVDPKESSFFRSIDGSTSIESLLAVEPGTSKSWRLNRLFLQLENGKLALLPQPLSKTELPNDQQRQWFLRHV